MTKLKPFPDFKTDEEAEHFLDTADLSEYDPSEFRPMSEVFPDLVQPTLLAIIVTKLFGFVAMPFKPRTPTPKLKPTQKH